MVFSSSTFLFFFLPIVLGLYFLCPGRRVKNIWLLVASLVFYAWGEPVYVLLMMFSIAFNWAIARVMGAKPARQPAAATIKRRAFLAIACIVNIALIGFFKYEGFLAENVNALLGFQLVTDLQLSLPIGISFYTLQALSYVIDVYRGDVPPQRNVLYLGMYIACFPQLIAGPIVRYQTIQDQILNRHENLEDFASGLRLFIVGLGKKVLLANTVALLADKMLAASPTEIGAIGAWAGIVAYTFQIFFDFSGYSDMAIGLGRMMGFKYLRNFNYPYICKSIGEFWRRWHISLYTFFRDYIYIPMGGSRVSTGRWLVNIAVVWFITGLWHGAAWNYVLWGLYYGVILACEKLVWGRALSKAPSLIQHLYSILLFMFGWLIFWIQDPTQFGQYLLALGGCFGPAGSTGFWALGAWQYLPVFGICIIASTPIAPWLKERLASWAEERPARSITKEGIARPKAIAADALCADTIHPVSKGKARTIGTLRVGLDIALVALMLASSFSVVSGSFNPFIYFQF